MNDGLIRDAAMLIRIAQRKNQLALDAALAAHGASTAQWAALNVIGYEPGLSAHALAVRSMQSDQSIGTLITPLVERGLVERIREGNRLLHYLTDHGRALVADCESAVRVALEERLGSLSGAELQQLCVLLERLTSDGPPVLFRRVKERNLR
jgi:DNA-binding MarR family transcriptional regulator